MSTEEHSARAVDIAFEELRARTNTVVLPYSAQLRQRGDRRQRVRYTAVVLVAAAAVIITSIGTYTTLHTAPPIGPAESPSAVPTTPAAGPTGVPRIEAPAPAPGEPATFPGGCQQDEFVVGRDLATTGEAIPQAQMLTATDWGPCYVLTGDEGGYPVYSELEPPHPDVCLDGRAYAADAQRVAGRYRTWALGSESIAEQTVTRYAPGQAAAFLAEVRARVLECAIRTLPGGGFGYSLASNVEDIGDECVLVYVGQSPTGGYPGLIRALVRVGDTVIMVRGGGDQGVDRARDLTMARVAVTYLG